MPPQPPTLDTPVRKNRGVRAFGPPRAASTPASAPCSRALTPRLDAASGRRGRQHHLVDHRADQFHRFGPASGAIITAPIPPPCGRSDPPRPDVAEFRHQRALPPPVWPEGVMVMKAESTRHRRAYCTGSVISNRSRPSSTGRGGRGDARWTKASAARSRLSCPEPWMIDQSMMVPSPAIVKRIRTAPSWRASCAGRG